MTEEVDGKTSLVLISGVFVLLMTIPGLAMFYGSLVSKRNLIDTMLQSVVLTGTVPVMWWLVAYSLSFDDSPHVFKDFFGGFKRSLLTWDADAVYSDISESAWCFFQLTFGILTAAIATGAVAERALLWPMIVIANLWLLLVYCPVCHMVWGGGLLMRWGAVDTAGGLVVETCSGLTALVLCYFVGPRSHPSDDKDPIRGVLHIVGAALLWVGWLVFNGGSAYTSGMRASTTVLNTMLAGSCGGLAWLGTAYVLEMRKGMLHLSATFHFMGGAVGGLCAATPSSGFVSPTGSAIIGISTGILCYFADHNLAKRLSNRGIDDVVSVFPVHGVGGMWGTLMTGVFAVERVGGIKGAVEGNWRQVGLQAVALLIVSAWSVVGTAVVAFAVSRTHTLRVTQEEELSGLDSRTHGQNKRFAKAATKALSQVGSSEDEGSTSDDGTDFTSGVSPREIMVNSNR